MNATSYAAFFFSGYLMMLSAWWWSGNDVTVDDAAIFAIGSALLGPLFLALYLFVLWSRQRPPRDPRILIRGRGK